MPNETKSDYVKYLELFPYIQKYQELATKYNIKDIFQDNGGKYLQLLMILELTTNGAREGNDAIDKFGNEYEIKTVNLELQNNFSTHHHMNPIIIEKYRKVDWLFAPFIGIDLQIVYKVKPDAMEFYYNKWETKWHASNGKDINNPKIPLKFVMQHGEMVWTKNRDRDFVIPKIIKDPNRVIVPRKKRTTHNGSLI